MQKEPEKPDQVPSSSQPLYEFVPGERVQNISEVPKDRVEIEGQPETPSLASSRLSEQEPTQAMLPHTADAIRQGLIYPPPPSFYENLSTSPTSILLPQPRHSQANVTPPLLQPTTPSHQKKSYSWLWIISGILACLLLTSCGLCSWAAYSLFSTTFQQVSGAVNTTENYYQAMRSQSYEDAYKYTALQGMGAKWNSEKFSQEAQQQDRLYGPIHTYTINQPSYANDPTRGPDFSRINFTIDIHRTTLHYTVLLTLREENKQWKIIYFDKI